MSNDSQLYGSIHFIAQDVLLAIRELSFSFPPPPDLELPRVAHVTPFSADNAFQKDSTEYVVDCYSIFPVYYLFFP